jgi:uncharacterized membrane protein YfcA
MLEAMSWVAGVVAILAFLGYSANFTVKVVVGAALSIIAFASAVSTLSSPFGYGENRWEHSIEAGIMAYG